MVSEFLPSILASCIVACQVEIAVPAGKKAGKMDFAVWEPLLGHAMVRNWIIFALFAMKI